VSILPGGARASRASDRRAGSAAAGFAVAFSLLAAPLVTFLRYHGASPFTGEASLLLAGLALVAALLAALFERGGPALRALGTGALLALLVDVQLEDPAPWPWIGVAFAGGCALAWWLRARWPPK